MVVTTSSPSRQASPAHTRPIPWEVDEVSAISSGAAPTTDAAAARTRPRRAIQCSIAAGPMRARRPWSMSSDCIACTASSGIGPLVPAFR